MTPPTRGEEQAAAMGAAAGAAAGVTVSLEVIYRTVLDVQQGQVEMRGDVREIKNKIERLGEDFNDHESRIRALERKVWTAAGTAAALAGPLGAVLTHLATQAP